MRACRSSSPRSKSCSRSRKSDCYKPCCLSQRRCQSLSPSRPSRQFYEQSTCSPCDNRDLLIACSQCRPNNPTVSCRMSKCAPRSCSPCQTRRCCYGDLDLPCSKYGISTRCESPVRCNYLSCDPYCPCKRDLCTTSICDPCFPRRNPCYPRTYDKCDPCYPTSCRPSYYLRRDPCLSCDPCYPGKCDTSCVPRWRSKFGSCTARKYCDPCYSPLCETLKCGPSTTCRPRYGLPCGDSLGVSRLTLRDLACDNFSKVCYPRELPIKSCTVTCGASKGTACETARVDPGRCPKDDGPSDNFYAKSRCLGNSLDRYEPHHCPWEADVSISGTVRGHCTSTALEVARRMSGRFRAEGDRYTTDSCENKSPCFTEIQRMSLGTLDDGTALNFSRNNDPRKMVTPDKNCDNNKPRETLQSSSHITAGSRGSNRKQHTEIKHGDDKYYYSVDCNLERDAGNTRGSGLPSVEDGSLEEIMSDKKSCSSRRSSHHSVRFGSENAETDFKSASEMKSRPQSTNNRSTSCNEVQHFLNSRKDRRRKCNHISSPARDTCEEMILKPSGVQRADDQRYANISPTYRSTGRLKSDDSSAGISPLFTPPTHRSPSVARSYSTSKPVGDANNIVLHSLDQEDHRPKSRHSEFQEVSLESSRVPRNRYSGYVDDKRVDRILEDRRVREHY